MPGSVRPVTDERDALLAYLAQQRDVLTLTAHGLTDEQARAVPSASELSVGGLIKHVDQVERYWVDTILQRQAPFDPDADWSEKFRLGPNESLEGVVARYRQAADQTGAVVATVADLGQPVPVPRDAPWFPADVEAWSVRWVLLHLITETARHAGHADIVRQSIDGATAYPLMAAAEQWPSSPWITPWTPRAQRV
jgi:uncharacterized damage-inducible protein DinB